MKFDFEWLACTLSSSLLFRLLPLECLPSHDFGQDTVKSIAIVGAGSAGLAMLKGLLDLPPEIRADWDIVLYEQRRDVGGIWLPDPSPAPPPELPETPLYPLLHTTTPVPVMTYPGFPFPPGTPLFPLHEYIEQYHRDYATRHDLWPYIRLNHTVLSSSWAGTSEAGHWEIVVEDHNRVRIQKSFDHLVVANGHNHEPHIVSFARQETWLEKAKCGLQREILHSIWYRDPSRYVNQTVIVVGSGASGVDIASQASQYARKASLVSVMVMVYNCPSDTAQSIYTASIIANGSLLEPRAELLRELADDEEGLRKRGYDPYYIGHRMVDDSAFDYQDDLIDTLRSKGGLPERNTSFVEAWRRDCVEYLGDLKRGWKRLEALGQAQEWLEGVESEEDWVDLMKRVSAWQRDWETSE
ncbi:hypothetical protein EDD15DRAFT_2375305 [Pisolithus albus]|nr:hypothetical protein EDD15DRAFT_2375305 [Pisolithus albus]